MIYQLVHHDGQNAEFVSQSPELDTEDAKNQWYANEVQGKQLPPGRQWAVLDSSHAWFSQSGPSQPSPWETPQPAAQEPSQASQPAGAGTHVDGRPDDVGPTNAPPQPTTRKEPVTQLAGEQPDFNDVMKDAQKRWNQERLNHIEDEREIQKLLRQRRKRK